MPTAVLPIRCTHSSTSRASADITPGNDRRTRPFSREKRWGNEDVLLIGVSAGQEAILVSTPYRIRTGATAVKVEKLADGTVTVTVENQ